eukprot:gene8008-5566_t
MLFWYTMKTSPFNSTSPYKKNYLHFWIIINNTHSQKYNFKKNAKLKCIYKLNFFRAILYWEKKDKQTVHSIHWHKKSIIIIIIIIKDNNKWGR